jgi:hypothetical protein
MAAPSAKGSEHVHSGLHDESSFVTANLMSSETSKLRCEAGSHRSLSSKARPSMETRKALPAQSLIPISGLGSGGPAAEIVRRGKTYSVREIALAARWGGEGAKTAAMQVLADLTSLNRTELALAASTLHDIAIGPEPYGQPAQKALAGLISTHLDFPESLHLAIQAIRVWEKLPGCASGCACLVEMVIPHLPRAGQLRSATRSSFMEQAHILSKAAATTSFALHAIAELRAFLEDRSPTLMPARRELAGLTLASIRKVATPSRDIENLKALASTVFSTGTVAPASRPTAAPIIQKQENNAVTAQQAEQRRQFGLAVTIELIKSIPLIGRPLNADEFENCLRFNFSPASILPANRFWPTRSEWHTMERCLEFAEQSEGLSPLRLAALFRILATRIKVEDPKDPRESKRRPDVLSSSERVDALKACQRIQNQANLAAADVDSVAQEIASRLLAPEFSGWVAELNEQSTTVDVPDDLQKPAAKVRELLDRVLSDSSGKVALRLTPEELRTLGSAQNLTLEEFKELARLLQPRAVKDEFARNTLLLLTQSQHAPEVTAVVRTATLGNLLNEARRYGKPPPDLEREVLAVSAKMPQLRF